MATTRVRVLASPDAIGDEISACVLERIAAASQASRRFLLGFPTGRTPRPILSAMARSVAESRRDMSHVVLVMMDEYLVRVRDGLASAPDTEPWSCRRYARVEIADRLNAALPAGRRLRHESVWLPDPRDAAAYDRQIADAGGIDFFLLASGASDGHVAFNSTGSPRDSVTRVVPLSQQTRRDNLQTFPEFGSIEAVPHHGVTVGISTIASAREAIMVVWGAGKHATLERMVAAKCYDPSWPATVIHECAVREIVADRAASGG